MSTAVEVISNITGFITYFAPGYIFLYCFYFAACLPRETSTEHLIIKSIALSYLLFTVVEFLNGFWKMDDTVERVLVFAVAILFGGAFGILQKTEWINGVSRAVFQRGFSRNKYVEIIAEAEQKRKEQEKDQGGTENRRDADGHQHQIEYVLLFHLAMNDETSYEGQVKRIDSAYTNPVISLVYYMRYDKEGKVVEDMTESDVTVLLQESNIKYMDYQIKIYSI